MMKHEFEALANETVTEDQWMNFGFRIFADMCPRAQKAECLEMEIQANMVAISKLQSEASKL